MLTMSCAPRRQSGRVRLGMFALTALAAAATAYAQQAAPAPAAPPAPPMATSVPPPSFAIKGFTVTGDNPLGDAETQRILAPYVRNDATIDTLQQAAGVLDEHAVDQWLDGRALRIGVDGRGDGLGGQVTGEEGGGEDRGAERGQQSSLHRHDVADVPCLHQGHTDSALGTLPPLGRSRYLGAVVQVCEGAWTQSCS